MSTLWVLLDSADTLPALAQPAQLKPPVPHPLLKTLESDPLLAKEDNNFLTSVAPHFGQANVS